MPTAYTVLVLVLYCLLPAACCLLPTTAYCLLLLVLYCLLRLMLPTATVLYCTAASSLLLPILPIDYTDAYRLLPTAYTGYWLLATGYWLLPTAYCPLPTAYCLSTACCLYCLLPTAYTDA